MLVYYNEIESNKCDWLYNLSENGIISKGQIDKRSILHINSSNLLKFTRCHFFSGIGGWDYALKLANWPEENQVWTGSCPCQPYSISGKGKGNADKRDLWPKFFKLIKQAKPITVFGEQVENAIKFGWLDRIQTDLEGEGYTFGAVVLGAHSVNAPHQRQRIFWVANHTISRSYKKALFKSYSTSLSKPNKDIFNFWNTKSSIYFPDGKYRRIPDSKSSILPLAYGIPKKLGHLFSGISSMDIISGQNNRTNRIQGYGNAIVPQIAAEFIKAFITEMALK